MKFILYLFFVPLQLYFLFYSWLMFLSVGGLIVFKLRYRKNNQKIMNFRKFALMLPAYKANRQIVHAVEACKAQKYPAEKYDIFVLAQHCTQEIIDEIKNSGAVVFEQTFDARNGNSYLHALNYFIDEIEQYASPQPYDVVVLIDKDNLLKEDFLSVINSRFEQGFLAVQGRRKPLNLDTNAACMDYVSETMNDSMFRAAKAGINFSAEISGSGMAFDFSIYKDAIRTVDFQSPVHDKTFLLELLKRQVHIFYEPNAILYEEKTDSYNNISQQRTRWIGGQFYLCRKNFKKLVQQGFKEKRWELVDYALTLLKIPRALHIAGLTFWIIFAAIVKQYSILAPQQWFVYLLCYFCCIIVFLTFDGAPLKVYKAILSSPKFIYSIFLSTIRIKFGKFNNQFIHTKHSKEISLTQFKR